MKFFECSFIWLQLRKWMLLYFNYSYINIALFDYNKLIWHFLTTTKLIWPLMTAKLMCPYNMKRFPTLALDYWGEGGGWLVLASVLDTELTWFISSSESGIITKPTDSKPVRGSFNLTISNYIIPVHHLNFFG